MTVPITPLLLRLLAIACATGAIAACGGAPSAGSRGDAQANPTSVARAFSEAYREATDRFQERTEAAQARGRDALEAGTGIREAYAAILSTTSAARDDYAALQPPPELKEDVDRLVDVLDRQVRSLEQVLAALDAGDESAADAPLQQMGALLGEMMMTQQTIQQHLDRPPIPP